jgi:superfamily II DNA or RNA helicase
MDPPMPDLRYHPVLRDAPGHVTTHLPTHLLVVGEEVPDSMTSATSTKMCASPPIPLPTGTYLFAAADDVDVMIVYDGAPPGSPTETEWSQNDHPLVHAHGWFAQWWDDATVITPPQFSIGDEISTVPSGQHGVIRSRQFAAGAWNYGVHVDGRTQQVREQKLAPALSDDDPTEWIQRPVAPARRFAATLTRAKLAEHLTDTVFSFRASRTLFRPYQFRPVIRLLATGRLRLLIADEVGLGKTIEAGLVWTELDARTMANRVLVVCPSMLTAKWRTEMEERFGFELVDLKREQLDDMLERIEQDRLPGRFHGVCSLERLRSWGGLERLGEIGPHFDLVIVDEAHAFRNTETRSFALGALLADWADALIFLSATPLNLGNDDLFNLLQLLAPGDFSDRALLVDRLEPNAVINRIAASLVDRNVDNATRLKWLRDLDSMTFGETVTIRPEFAQLVQLLSTPSLTPIDITDVRRLVAQLHALSAIVTRTRKVEIEEHKAVREARTIDVEWTPQEFEFYQSFQKWQFARARKLGLPIGFVTQMPLRLAGSCLPASRERLLSYNAAQFDQDLDADEETTRDPDLDLPPADLLDEARRLGDIDSKFDQFLPQLRQIVSQGKQVLLFTFSRATLAYLHRRLLPHMRLGMLHGGVVGDERHRIMREFREGRFDVVLASRVASEGLDFEFCSAVVNYDLPWNPMEVEQRIGRIDRFGQVEDKVIILNFATPGTIETDIVARLMNRIGVFKDSVGDLEPILQSHLPELRQVMFDFELTPEQRVRRMDEVVVAMEEQQRARDEIDSATAYLSSTDNAEIDGLERDLLASGRYVGQPELLLLLEDWASACPGATCVTSADDKRVTVRGNREMEQHLRGVQARGERSAAEIDRLARNLRDEHDIVLALDQELARTSGDDLLSANHPLTRGALGVPGHVQARFTHLRVANQDLVPGHYFVLLAVARWHGVRSGSELWTTAVSLLDMAEAPDEVGAAVLSGLATAQLRDGSRPDADLQRALARTQSQLLTRQATEEAHRIENNRALVVTRQISLRETHDRKVEQIQQRIRTLQEGGKTGMIHLHEAQMRNQDRQLEEKVAELESAAAGSLTVEYLAATTVEIVGQA